MSNVGESGAVERHKEEEQDASSMFDLISQEKARERHQGVKT